MVSKSTKSIASRIPLDLHFTLQKEADDLELNMKDYLLKIIEARHAKTAQAPVEKPEIIEPVIPPKKTKSKTAKSDTGSNEIEFPEL